MRAGPRPGRRGGARAAAARRDRGRAAGALGIAPAPLARGMAALRPDWHWKVVVNSKVTDLPHVPHLERLSFPKIDRSGVSVRVWYEDGLPGLLARVGANILFSQTNYLPTRRLPCPSLLLVQNAGHFSSIFDQLTMDRSGPLAQMAWRLKRRWVRSSCTST